jgi:hypothetical protein
MIRTSAVPAPVDLSRAVLPVPLVLLADCLVPPWPGPAQIQVPTISNHYDRALVTFLCLQGNEIHLEMQSVMVEKPCPLPKKSIFLPAASKYRPLTHSLPLFFAFFTFIYTLDWVFIYLSFSCKFHPFISFPFSYYFLQMSANNLLIFCPPGLFPCP